MNHPPLYTMTFAEVCERGERRETLVSMQGYLISGRDRAFNKIKAQELWAGDIKDAQRRGLLMPQQDSRPTNAKGKPFTWSYSALSDFEGCPLRYSHRRFYCDVEEPETEALRWGNRVHKAAEDHVNGAAVADTEALKEVERYARMFRGMKEQGHDITVEMEVALTEDLKVVSWFSPKAWYRGKLDVTVKKAVQGFYYDFKTGAKVKDDEDQLKICCAAWSIVDSTIEVFTPKLIWTKHQTTTGIQGGSIDKAQIAEIWEQTLARVDRMKKAWQTETFQARPSGLCKWKTGQCPYYDRCDYARRR